MHRDAETGMVVVDEDKCMGCWTCMVACPNGALTRDLDNRIVAKCDLCIGSEVPACVANCPNEALKLVEEEASEESQAVSSGAGRQEN